MTVLRERVEHGSKRTREPSRSPPPLLERGGAKRRGELAHRDVRECSRAQHLDEAAGVVERERVRDTGRGQGLAELGADHVEDDPEPRIARSRPPDGDHHAPTWAKDARDLAGRARRVDREHQPLAAEHDVEGAVGLVDLLEVEHADAHVLQPERRGARLRDRGHLDCDVGEHDLAAGADEIRGREPHAARAARQLEHTLTGHRRRELEHPRSDSGPARVDVRRVLAPRRSHGSPHGVHPRAQLLVAPGGVVACPLTAHRAHLEPPLIFNYTLSVMK